MNIRGTTGPAPCIDMTMTVGEARALVSHLIGGDCHPEVKQWRQRLEHVLNEIQETTP